MSAISLEVYNKLQPWLHRVQQLAGFPTNSLFFILYFILFYFYILLQKIASAFSLAQFRQGIRLSFVIARTKLANSKM